MSEFSSNFSKIQSQAFAAALQKAKEIAAKIQPLNESSGKRPLEDGVDPDPKKLARPEVGRVNLTPQLMNFGPATTEEIKVPDKMVGLIIGRGGEQITRLQSESGCKIQMAPDSGGAPDRLCSLTGSQASIQRAKELINSIVSQRYKTETPRDEPPAPQGHFIEVMIPGSKVGLIIGKGGETIKGLQEKSGAKMIVIQDAPNQETEKPLRITGDPAKVEVAKNLLYELLAEKDAQGSGRDRDRDRFPRNSDRDRRTSDRPNFRGNQDEATFLVPAAKCGVVIGRGGETIKQINQQTGAHCELDRRQNPNPNEKVFVIRGSAEQIEAAKALINEKLGPTASLVPMGAMGSEGGEFGGGSAAGSASSWNYGYEGGSSSDYSQQWIEYYRSMGMVQEAQAIEAQVKNKTGGQPSSPAANGNGPGTGGGAGAGNHGAADYSAQWAQYYRSIGKFKEAEMIELQIKNKGSGTASQAPPASTGSSYPFYPGYGGSGYSYPYPSGSGAPPYPNPYQDSAPPPPPANQ